MTVVAIIRSLPALLGFQEAIWKGYKQHCENCESEMQLQSASRHDTDEPESGLHKAGMTDTFSHNQGYC